MVVGAGLSGGRHLRGRESFSAMKVRSHSVRNHGREQPVGFNAQALLRSLLEVKGQSGALLRYSVC